MAEMQKTDKATFTIQIKFQQNATWQGSIHWLETNQIQQFRSELEMLHLMMQATSKISNEGNVFPDWQVSE